MQELSGVQGKWESIGRTLELSEDYIKDISTMYGTSHDCLRETLSRWLRIDCGLYDSIHELTFVPTWTDIVTALRSPSIGESQLADQLEAKYCPNYDGM